MLRACFRYGWYITRHKWFVLLECWRIGLYWRGIVHDLSKLRPSEFFPYASHFYGHTKPQEPRAFDVAWLRHVHRNPHHWQHWNIIDDGSAVCQAFEMPETCVQEMVCDWAGAARAQHVQAPAEDPTDRLAIRAWYRRNGPKMLLHPATRALCESLIYLADNSAEVEV